MNAPSLATWRNGQDALAVAYHPRSFLERFLARWPQGSSAHASYFQRIIAGPEYDIATARG